jgi:tRNA A-37 threonylcarbamoyl transferase component Bud32
VSLSRLRQICGPRLNVDAAWAEFCRDHGDDDPMAFAVWLAERRQLTIEELRTYLLDGDLHLRPRVADAKSAFDRLALLGKGAMGEVFVARDRLLNRNVAVKQIDPAMADDPVLLRRFYTEAQITAQLDHPGIVPVFGLEVQGDGSLAYAMRIVRGRTLREYLDETRAFYVKGRRPDAAHALQARLLLFDDLCKVLQHAHERGVLHRDLKPANVMVGPFGEVLVMDWGIAKVIGRKDELPVDIPDQTGDATETGATIGTARYMSPEQASGENERLDARSDQYSLGLLLYELVTLEKANPGKDANTCRTAAQRGRVAPVVHFRGEPVARDLEAIIRRATALRPADRYADVGALAADVRRFLADESVAARPDRGLQRVVRLVGRYRRAALVAIGGLSTSLVLLVAGFVVVAAVAVAVWTAWATAREQALARVLSAVSSQGRRIDGAFAGYAARVEGMRGAAAFALTHPAPGQGPIYLASSFDGPPEGRPPDLVTSAAYEDEASLLHADVVLAPGADPVALGPRLQQLRGVVPELRRVLLDAIDPALPGAPEKEQRARLLDEGGPIVWTYVATEDGILEGMPGVGDYPEGYDPRTTVWYRLGRDATDVAWEASMDESGGGLLLTGVSAVRDEQHRPLGVVGLDLTVAHVAEALLVPQGLPPVRARLVDPLGLVLIDTHDPTAADTKLPLGYPEVRDAVLAGRGTGLEELGDELVVWTTIDQVGWTYVVSGDADALISGAGTALR